MDAPLYMTVEQAAQYTGIGQRQLRAWLNGADPMPYLRVGNRRYIQRDALPAYLEARQEVRR